MALPADDRDFRLPDDVRPVRYQVHLHVDLEARRFSGRARMSLELGRPTAEVALHGAGLEVTRSTFRVGGEDRIARTEPLPRAEALLFRLPEALPAGPAELEVEWTGQFSDGLRGLYRAGPLAVTQFEASDARRVFPCFDEPGFKAPWAVTLEVPGGAVVLANGRERSRTVRGDRAIVEFEETPPIPTYLVALAVGPLGSSAEAFAGAVPVRTWSVPEKASLTGFAQEVALAVLPRLEEYFGLPYAFGKLDQVGVPDFEFGAMENAGLVVYREAALLLDPSTAALAVTKRVAEVITHELAHQWFGNWVTMKWWDDLWLNESFATWMAFKIVDGWRPSWRIWLDFDQGRSAALHLDALRSTHPIRAEVKNPEDMGEAFDLITYEKGGAVLRMLEAWLGESGFREGIRLYMRRFGRGNATAEDLWAALEEATGQPVLELANAWIRQPGYPIVTIESSGRELRLSQWRFFADPGAAEHGVWPVPLLVRFADATGVREERVLLRTPEAGHVLRARGEVRWAYANGGVTGFYRVDHGAGGVRALSRHLGELAPAERAALLSDEWALVRAGVRGPEPFLDVIAALAGEEDRAVLDELVNRLAAIEHRLPGEAARDRFRRFSSWLLRPSLAAVGWDARGGEGDEDRLRRAALVRGLALVARDADATEEAKRRFDRYLRGDRAALEPNLHDAAVAVAARGGDAGRFEELRRLYREEKDPAYKRRYLLGLALFEDPALARRAVEMPFGDEVPLQDLASFAGALFGNRATADGFWALVRAGWGRLEERLAEAPLMLRRIVEGVGALTERRHLEEAEAFFAAHPVPAARQGIAQTLERLRLDVELWERIGPAVEAWLAGRPGAAR
ncbi:MAG TPA: M1 family aminopeptidase [Anaeromyxobacteraceae bacterium]|nr:M1 family aminopeptidase [Anaeromyxobacteraceae bacterium]